MIVPVMAISNLVLTQQIYSQETNGAHAHYREPVPLMSSSQSEERTVFLTREKIDTSNQNPNDIFHVLEKWCLQSKATDMCEFRPKVSAFYRRLKLAAPLLCKLLRRY